MSFIGCECYDLILYLAKTLNALGASVLIIDNSDDRSLSTCIPTLDSVDLGQPVDYNNGITTVRGLEDVPNNFEYVLIYHGKDTLADLSQSNEVFLVTDYQKHNVEFLQQVELDDDNYPLLVIRDRVSSKITPASIQEKLSKFEVDPNDVLVIDDTNEDLQCKVLCQYNTHVGFQNVSASIKEFIYTALSEYDRKSIKGAIRLASTRRK